MANIRITDLVTLTEPVSTDVLPIVDVSLDVTKKISIAEVLRTAALGNQTDPGISFDGDADTGVYSPGANQLAFTTNGSEALRIDSDGLIGIGTSSPNSFLQIGGAFANTSAYVTFGKRYTNTESTFPFIGHGASVDGDPNSLGLGTTSANGFIRFYTGSAAPFNDGNERLRITSDGLVGIGTTNPEAKLSIAGTNTNGGIKIVDSSTSASSPGIEVIAKRGDINDSTSFSGKLLLARNRTEAAIVADNQLGSVSFGGNHTDGTEANILYSAALIGVADGDFNDDSDMPTALAFYTGSTGWSPDTANASPGTERLRITSDGRVGIGTTVPGERLSIKDSAGAIINLESGVNVASLVQGINLYGRFVDGVTPPLPGQLTSYIHEERQGSGAFAQTFGVSDGTNDATERVRITSGGLVGIGTTAPGRNLTVDGGAGTIIAAFQSTGTGCGFGLKDATTSADNTVTIRAIGNDLISHAGGQERMRIKSDGNVGIGTTVPGYALEVLKASPTYDRVAQFNSNSTVSLIAFGGSNGVGEFAPEIGQDNSTLVFNTQNQERVRIDVSGLVGIGTTSPTALLHLAANAPYITFEDKDNNQDWQLQATAWFALRNQTTASELLRITSGGNVGIGTTNPRVALQVNGEDVTLGGTLGTTNSTLDIVSDTTTNNGADARPGIVFRGPYSGGADRYSHAAIFSLKESTAQGVQSSSLVFGTNQTGGGGVTEKMRIASDGNVGIGTTSPGVKLQVENSDADANVVINRSGAVIPGNLNIASGNSANYIFSGGAKPLQIATNNTERLRIDSNGRLLVGTSSGRLTSTVNWLSQIEGLNLTGLGITSNSNNANGAYLSLAKSRGTAVGSNTIVSEDDLLGGILFSGADGTDANTQGALIGCYVDGTPGANDMPGRLVFSTTADGGSSPTERMRITQNGDVLIGQTTTNTPGGGNTTAGHSINRNGTVYHSGLGGISLIVNRSTSDGAVQSLRRDGTQVGTISVTTSSTAYNTSSDYRLKENVVPLANAADRVNQLQVHRFNFIADPETTVDGFLAHEAQAVVPECVTGTKDEVDDEGNPVYQGIDQSKMVPLAVAAIQECIKRIEALETELALLKSGN